MLVYPHGIAGHPASSSATERHRRMHQRCRNIAGTWFGFVLLRTVEMTRASKTPENNEGRGCFVRAFLGTGIQITPWPKMN